MGLIHPQQFGEHAIAEATSDVITQIGQLVGLTLIRLYESFELVDVWLDFVLTAKV